MYLSEEDFKTCQGWEDRLARAQHGNMLTLGRKGVLLLMEIYARTSGKPAPHADRCGSCELRVQKQVGQWYFADKKERENNKQE